MNWEEFKTMAADLAAVAENLIEQNGVVLIGTIRKDGSPRISPVEAIITDGKLYLGLMWQSLKAQDLLRDSRCTIHTIIKDRMASEGEFKLHGRAVEVEDDDERQRYCEALYKKIGWNPSDFKFHLFWIDIKSAGLFIAEGNKRILKRWRVGEELKQYSQGVDGKLIPIKG